MIGKNPSSLTYPYDIFPQVISKEVKHTPTENEIKAAPQIELLLTQLRNDGRKPGTVKNYRKSLAHLIRDGADLFDPESAKAALAKSPLRDSTKKTVAAMLAVWFEFNGIRWKPPKYADENEIPFIPTEQEIDLLIAALGQKTACFCQLLKDTGARCGEIAELKWTSIDWHKDKFALKLKRAATAEFCHYPPKPLKCYPSSRETTKTQKEKTKFLQVLMT